MAWIVIGGIACIVALRTAAQRRETRARLFEVLRLALLRGQAIAPILRNALSHVQTRTRLRPALRRSAERAEAGQPIAEALLPIATREQRVALRRVGDEHGLASLLRAFAEASERQSPDNDRARMLCVYAMLITGFITSCFTSLSWQFAWTGYMKGLLAPARVTMAVFALAAIVMVLLRQDLPGLLGSLRESIVSLRPVRHLVEMARLERALRCAAMHIAEGGRLAAALRRAACLALDRRYENDLRVAAESLDHGVPWDEVVAQTRLPNFVRVRLHGVTHSPSRAAALFAEAADACARRHDRRVSSTVRVALPAVMLSLGALVAWQFAALMNGWFGIMLEGGSMSSQRGFSFVEVCVALTVLWIAASASFLGSSVEQRTRIEAQQAACARRVASSLFERARAAAVEGDPYQVLLRDPRASALPGDEAKRSLSWRTAGPRDAHAGSRTRGSSATLDSARLLDCSLRAEFEVARDGLVAMRVLVSWRPNKAAPMRRLDASTWIVMESAQ